MLYKRSLIQFITCPNPEQTSPQHTIDPEFVPKPVEGVPGKITPPLGIDTPCTASSSPATVRHYSCPFKRHSEFYGIHLGDDSHPVQLVLFSITAIFLLSSVRRFRPGHPLQDPEEQSRTDRIVREGVSP